MWLHSPWWLVASWRTAAILVMAPTFRNETELSSTEQKRGVIFILYRKQAIVHTHIVFIFLHALLISLYKEQFKGMSMKHKMHVLRLLHGSPTKNDCFCGQVCIATTMAWCECLQSASYRWEGHRWYTLNHLLVGNTKDTIWLCLI